MDSAGSPLCEQCREPGADIHTLLCPACLIALPPFFRKRAEEFAIYAALLRHTFVENPMGAVRWSEQQYRDYLRKAQSPPEPEPKKARKPAPPKRHPRALMFSLPLTPMRNGLDRMHWQAKRKLMQSLGDMLREQIPLSSGCPLARAKVEIIRYSASEPDPDGLAGSVKPVLDAMQVPRGKLHPYGAYIIENDNSECIDLHVRWEKAPPKHGKVVVIVTPIP